VVDGQDSPTCLNPQLLNVFRILSLDVVANRSPDRSAIKARTTNFDKPCPRQVGDTAM
jgi:hypothetical protein